MTKDWTGNKKSLFATLGASNHSTSEREANDYYATEPATIDKLLGAIELPTNIWECACGEGHLSERLKQFGHHVVSSDIVDRGYGEVADFLETSSMPTGCECILTNPPYKYALEFVLHALDILPQDGLCAMFLKTTFLEGQRRYNELFRLYPQYCFCSSPNECYVPRTASLKSL